MNRTWWPFLFAVVLGVIASGCNTAAPAPYYSSRRDLLGQPAPTKAPPNTIDDRLSGTSSATPNQSAPPSTNSPPRQTQ